MDRGSLPSDEPLVVAVASSSPSAKGYLAVLCIELSRALRRPVVPKVLASYPELSEEVARGGAHVAWAPPLVAIDLEREHLTSIALCCTRGGEMGYHAALFTQHASRISTLADLEGAHVAWVDRNSSAGYLVPRMHIASAGFDPAKHFARESFLGTHERVACAVLAGEVDAGATYVSLDPRTRKPVTAGWLEAGAGVNGAFVIATAGPIPADAIVLANRLSGADKELVTQELRRLPATIPDAIGGLLRADGFAVPEPAHFDTLRALSAAFRAR